MSRPTRSFAALLGLALLVPRPAGATPPPFLQVDVGGGVMSRKLAWNDDLFGDLREYRLGAAPLLAGRLVLFPAAPWTRGPGSWLGLVLEGDGTPTFASQRSGHEDGLPTIARSASAALRLRVPAGFGAALLDAGWTERSFDVSSAGTTAPDFPAVHYAGPRLALGAELALPLRLSLAAHAGGALYTSLGDVGSDAWFPRAHGKAVDVGVTAAFRATPWLGPYLDLSWSRALLDLRPEPGDPHVAGGAADDRYNVVIGIRWTLVSPESNRPQDR